MPSTLTAFLDDQPVAKGEREEVTRLASLMREDRRARLRVFEDETGRATDLDYSSAHSAPAFAGEGDQPKAGGGARQSNRAQRGGDAPSRGRPRLGVVSREITLLPRQWDWLAGQPGGASATIRRLVEKARTGPRDPAASRDAACRFMTDMCGDRPGYEEALRALYRGERERFESLIEDWPPGIRAYIAQMLE